MDSPPAADELFPTEEDELSDVLARFGLMILSRLPRPRPETGGGFAPIIGAETETGTGAGAGDLVGDTIAIAAAELLALTGSGLLCIFVTETLAGDVRGVLVTTGSLLVEGRGGSMLSFGT